MKFTQKLPITSKNPGPYTLQKIYKAIGKSTTRKKFVCGHRAIAELRGLKLDPEKYYGAEVIDRNGFIIAEVE